MATRLSSMYTAGVSAVRTRLGTTFALYGANALFGLVFTAVASLFLAGLYARHPLFDRGVNGDVMALVACVLEERSLIPALLISGLGLAGIYFVVSEYLAGGLLERLADREPLSRTDARRRFGAGAAAHLGRFLRVWVWSWILWVPALIALSIGLAVGTDPMSSATAVGPVVSRLFVSLLPGLALAALAALAADYARLLLVRDPALIPRRAFFRAVKLLFKQPASLLHFVSYVAAWLLVSGVYVLLTANHVYPGVLALALLVLRQLLVFARVALRVAAFGGQQVLLDAAP